MCTHEQYISAVRDIATVALQPEQAAKLQRTKLVYGVGSPSLRGVTYFHKWQKDGTLDLAEICAFGEENKIQLAGTTLHELAHVLAGPMAGHGKEWRLACETLGLRRAKAAGNHYIPAQFAPVIRAAIAALPDMTDGKPSDLKNALIPRNGGCLAGIGTRGGKSRGAGSGSRLRKFVCACGTIIRAARDELHVECMDCRDTFKRAD